MLNSRLESSKLIYFIIGSPRKKIRKRKRRSHSKMGSTRRQPRSLGSESNTHSDCNDDKFGFQSGPEFIFEEFEAFTKEFKELYFGTNDNEVWRPSIKEIKGDYWCIIEKPTDEVEVNYGDDLKTGVFDSGFPLVLQICMQLLVGT
ncbi:hypothetical protein P3S68_016557 [Capsicum galapagoense]